MRWPMTRRRNLTAVAWCFLVAACAGCTERPPNFLIISLESTRWDHLGVAGYARPVTPNIDALARRGTYFKRAYAQSSWTRPSVASLFTSSYLSTHRVTGEREGSHSKIPLEFETLAERFGALGYRSVGWSSSPQLWKGFGFGQGFDRYNGRHTPDPAIVQKARKLVLREEKPFLAFAHLIKPHLPYGPAKRFRLPDTPSGGVAIGADNHRKINSGEIELTPADIAYNIALYDGALLQVDSYVGEILANLSKSPNAEETIVVLMADHGDEFYDHAKVGHGVSLYDELIRVPLILAGRGIPQGRVVETPVQNIDVLPTLIELAGGIAEGAQGRSLVPFFSSGARSEPSPVFSETASSQAVIDGRWKGIYKADGWMLFDVVADPHERNDLSQDPASEPRLQRLASLLEEFNERNREIAAQLPSATAQEIPDEVLERMRALGYMLEEE